MDGRDRMIEPALQERLKASYGALFSAVEAGLSAPHCVTLRANTLKASADEVADALSAAGIGYERVSWYEDAFRLPCATEDAVRALPLYEAGKVYLQSLSSMLPPLVLQPQAGENILDMTAAPGGKTTQLLALSKGKALITACERDNVRFERLRFNLERQGAARVNALHRDALTLDDALRFDKILLDAPCTGAGTVGARVTQGYLEKCVRAQKKLIHKALRLLKKGGTLVYSTCSIFPEENGGVVEEAVKCGAKIVPVEAFDVPRLPSPSGTLTVMPACDHEGFFVAKLTK